MLNKEKPVQVTIDENKCNKCHICVDSCPGEYLVVEGNSIKANENSLFGCLQCGHCMMSCPNDCIKITGEGLSGDDVIALNNKLPDYNAIDRLFKGRRSTRKFKNQEVPNELIDKIIDAASTSPISIPPSEVKVLVINGFDKVQEFADDIVASLGKFQKIMNPFTLNLFKPMIGQTNYKLFSDFILPLIKSTIENRKEGTDILFYNAPAVVVFYGTELTEATDQVLAATYATIAAESLGLGTCIIGTVPPALMKNNKLREKYGLLKGEKPGIAFVLGYPEGRFNKGIKRRLKEVRYY